VPQTLSLLMTSEATVRLF